MGEGKVDEEKSFFFVSVFIKGKEKSEIFFCIQMYSRKELLR